MLLFSFSESPCAEPEILNGTVSPTGSIGSGESVNITCKTGHSVKGSEVMTCLKGKFDGEPTCEGIYCGYLSLLRILIKNKNLSHAKFLLWNIQELALFVKM